MQTNTQTFPSKPALSLRERCGVKFRLVLSPPYFKSTQPSFNNLPRRRKRTCVPPLAPEVPPSPPDSPASPLPKPGTQFLCLRRKKKYTHIAHWQGGVQSFDYSPGFDNLDNLDNLLATPITPCFAERDECRCLQEIIPGCYVAFEDDNAAWYGLRSKDTLATPNGRLWTHVISISNGEKDSSSSEDSSDGSESSSSTTSSDTYDEAVQTLRLFLPPAPDVEAEDEDAMRTALTENQLLDARDFLSFHGHPLNWNRFGTDREFPSSPCSSTSSTLADEKPAVRLLITVPRNRRADAMSVATCYLAFAFATSVETILRELNTRPRFLPVWKYALDSEGAKFVDRVAAISRV